MIATSEEALRRRLERDAIEIDLRVETLVEGNLNTVGTQAALLAGFAFSSIQLLGSTSAQLTLDDPAIVVWQLTATASFLIEIHVILQCTLVNIYGPILSTNGPSGSLPIAIKAMRSEQQKIITNFFVGVVFLIISVTAFYWATIADSSGLEDHYFHPSVAGTLTGLTIVALAYMLWEGLRVYGRFVIPVGGRENLAESSIKSIERRQHLNTNDIDSSKPSGVGRV